MKIHSPLFVLVALGLMSTTSASLAAPDTSNWKCQTCPYPKATTGSVDVGLSTVSDDSARFGDYTGLHEKGAKLALGGTLSVRGGSGYYADLDAANLGLDSRSVSLRNGHEGLYSLNLAYSETPRYLADGALTPFQGVGGASLTLPAGYPAAGTSTMPLGSSLQPVDIGFKKKRFELAASVVSFQNWTYRASYSRDARSGTRPVTASFFSTAAQLAAPVDLVTDQIEVSAAYATRDLQARLAYQISRFSNGEPSLVWSNPFQPVVAGATRGQLALAPDNQLHQIVGSAGWQITPGLRASGDFAVGQLTQNEGFLAPTLNTSLAGIAALQAGSLDGKVDTFNSNIRLTAAPVSDLRVNAAYSRNVRSNKSAVHGYPQIATDIFVDPQTRDNTPFGFTQDRVKFGADYRGFEAVKLSAGADLDYRSRSYTEVVRTRETTVWGRAGLQTSERLALAFKLSKASRDHSAYGTAIWFGAAENPLMRKYNLARRDRDTAGVRADLAATDTVSLGLSMDYSNDGYGQSLVGLKHARSATAGADIAWAVAEKTQFTAFWQNERLSSTQAGSAAGRVPDWTAYSSDRFSVLGLGLKHSLLGDKLVLGADWVLSRSKSDLSVDAGFGEPLFPQANTAHDTYKFTASYKLGDSLWLNGSFWHERYAAADWRVDGVLPSTLQNLLAFGQQQPSQYRLNALNVTLRYQF